MKTLINPSEEQLADLLVRPGIKTDDLEKIGRDIFTEVGKTGDAAVEKIYLVFRPGASGKLTSITGRIGQGREHDPGGTERGYPAGSGTYRSFS